MKLLLTASLLALGLVAFSHDAYAKGVICERVQADEFSIDGMTDDWPSFKGVRYGTGNDAALEIKCGYDDAKLYLLLSVSDERLMRTKSANAKKEDRLQIDLRVGKAKPMQFSVLPGSLRAPRKLISVPSGVELEDSLQDAGFSVELSIPLKKFPNWSPSVPYLQGSVRYYDMDSPSASKAQSVVGLSGRVHFGDAVQTYKAFMRTVGLSNKDVKLDKLVDADPGLGPERVIIGGKVIGLVGTSFNNMTLPIASAKDLIDCSVVDFDAAGRYAVITELRQYGNGGSRDVVIVWYAQGDGSFEPALTFETRKELGGNSMANSWSLVPRGLHRDDGPVTGKGKRKGKNKAVPGKDILIQVGAVSGFDASNYREAPAPDAKAILVPWGDAQSALYYFEGTTALGGAPGIDLPKK